MWRVAVLLCGCGRIAFDHVGAPDDGMLADVDGDATSGTLEFVQGAQQISTLASSLNATLPAEQRAESVNVVVIGTGDITASVVSVVDTQGTAYALAVGPTDGNSGRQWMYVGVIATAGTNAITVTFDGQSTQPGLMVAEYSGVSTTNPVQATAADVGVSMTSSSGPLTITQVPAMLVGANTNANPSTMGPGVGFVERMRTGWEDILEDRVVDTLGVYAADAPLTTVHAWVMQAIALAPR